jgi:hypothetical protein
MFAGMDDDERSQRASGGRRRGAGRTGPEPVLVAGVSAGGRGERVAGDRSVGDRSVRDWAVRRRVGGDRADPERLAGDRAARDRTGVRPRRTPGPRPVRPLTALPSVRPAPGERPPARVEAPARACPNRQRTLARHAPAAPMSTAGPSRRLLAGALVALLAAAVVVGLGQLLALAEGAAPASARPAAVAAPTGLVTVGAEPTVWELARRIEPAADGVRQAELAERIAVANALTSVELRPGQVLRVPAG